MSILYDANGVQIPVRVVRKRMGFLGGDLLPDDDRQNEPPNISGREGDFSERRLGNGSHIEEQL